MKHYLDKLNKKPKLKKCLKLIMIIGICLSFVFNAVIIGVAIAQRVRATNNNEKPLSNLVTTPIHKAWDYNGMVYIEGVNNMPLEVWQEYASAKVGSENAFTMGIQPNVYSEVSFTITNLEITYCNDLDIFLMNEWGSQTQRSTEKTINSIQFRVVRYRAEPVRCYYQLIFNIDVIGTRTVTYCKYDSYYEVNDEYVNDFSGDIINRYGPYPTNGYGDSLVNEGIVFGKYDGPLYDAYDKVTGTWYQGYQEGLSLGRAEGERTGYSKGYQAGLDNSPSNVFDYLACAFNSVASILNIQVLPNLSLGILLFAPVIVSIIIVVVKMIKG